MFESIADFVADPQPRDTAASTAAAPPAAKGAR